MVVSDAKKWATKCQILSLFIAKQRQNVCAKGIEMKNKIEQNKIINK